MTKKIVKRTDANNEILYFYTHSDAVDVGEGNATTSLTAALNNKANTSDVQALSDDALRKSSQSLSSQEKEQVHNNIGTESFVDDRAVRYDDAQVLGSEEKTQALTNLGLNGVDDEPTPNSDNLVKSGGVQNELALGAVYDVSAKNPTAGSNNDGKFESLSALLSDANLNTLIPSAFRRGGMSIKFVLSSDNKYVQYRYMKTVTTAATFTNVANWQGVDDVPTTGSDNLVKSGGVVDYCGVYNIEKELSVANLQDLGTFTVEKAPFEFAVEIIDSGTVEFEESAWLYLSYGGSGRALSGNPIYYKETGASHLADTTFNLKARKVSVAGILKIKVSINGSSSVVDGRMRKADADLATTITTIGESLNTIDNNLSNLLLANGVINVNAVNNVPNTVYTDAATARAAVPSKYRKYGLVAIFKLSDGWHVEQYIGDKTSTWATTDTLWKQYDYKKEHLIYNVNYNPNAQSSNTGYTLAEAIAAVPAEYRCVARAITYFGKDGVGHLAIFNRTAFRSGFTNEEYWSDFSKVLLNDFYKLGNLGGCRTGELTCEAPATRTFLVGDSTYPGLLIDDDKFFFNVLDSDSYGFWRFYIFYDDDTKAFAAIKNGKNEFTKKVRGISICVNVNSNSCFLNYEIYTHIRCDIRVIENDIVALQNRTYTASEVGAVGVAQGIGNVGKSLIVGSDGNVTLGEPSPIGVLDGYGKIQSTMKLYLKADIAEEVSVGAGWSGSLTNGYTHTAGNTENLVLGHTETGKKYLVTLNFSDLSENTVEVKIGNGYAVDPYNGTTQSSVGFISDGGDLIVTPNSNYSGTIRVKLQEVTDAESAVEDITLTIANFDAGQLADNISGFWNVAIGASGNQIHNQNASRNISVGNQALRELISGSRNIGIGTFALAQLRYGKGNIGIGADTYYRRQGGDDNVAIGRACMSGATESVNNNTCVGRSAGERVTGDDNVCIGTTAGYAVTSGNVCIGVNAGFSHNAGVNNIFIGRNAGYSGAQRTGAWNTAVGPSASISNNVSKSVALGFQAVATKSNQNVIGCKDSVETKVFGDLVVHGTDGIDRKIIFNQDGSVGWEQVL